MPNPDDDFFDLPEYPVRPSAPTLRLGAPDSVWARYPMGSRIVAALAITCLLAPVVAFFRGNGGSTASAETAMVDGAVLDVTAGPDVSVADKPAEVTAAVEGTLPPTVATQATLPRTTPTTVPVKKAAVAPQTSTAQVVKPSTATTAKKTATTAKPVVKPAATTQATSKAAATTAAPVVKAPAASTTPRTTRPQAVTTEAAPAPEKVWTTDEVQALIHQMWPADSLEKALRVAFRESRYQADAYNGWCCYGVFQINGASHKHRLAARGLATKDLLDPRINIEIAVELYNEQGWGPWGG